MLFAVSFLGASLFLLRLFQCRDLLLFLCVCDTVVSGVLCEKTGRARSIFVPVRTPELAFSS